MNEQVAVYASGKLGGRELLDIPVLNAGNWFGRPWLIEIGGSYWALFVVVEADSICDALEELADHPKYGHNIKIDVEGSGGDYGFDVHRGDVICCQGIEESGWMNLKGEFFKERPPCVSEPWITGGGDYCDLDNVMVHGEEGRHVELPWPCVYTSPGDPLVPPEGMDPRKYCNREEEANEDD